MTETHRMPRLSGEAEQDFGEATVTSQGTDHRP